LPNVFDWVFAVDFLDMIGIIGVIGYVGAYLTLQLGLIKGDGYLFPSVNLVAALAVLASLTRDFNPFSVSIEICWAVISLIGIVRIYVVHRFINLSEEEAEVARRIVPSLKKDMARKLLRLGKFVDVDEGYLLTSQGQPVANFAMIMGGICQIERGSRPIATISAGAMVGELTLSNGAPATATVHAVGPGRLFLIGRSMLWGFLQQNPEAMADMERSIAGDLRVKLADTTVRLSGVVEDRNSL
jgi:CRP-like cAMP-binding protein